MLDKVGGPLLASSMHVEHEENEDFELPNGMALMQAYSNSGIDFMVSVGSRMVQESTVIPPKLINSLIFLIPYRSLT